MRITQPPLGRIFEPAAYTADELAEIATLIGFDVEYYLAKYPDIAKAGLDPLRHFLGQGVDELRLPAGGTDPQGQLEALLGFNPAFYAAQYPDAASDPRGHFMSNGARERRLPFDLVDNLAAEQLLARVLKPLVPDAPAALEAQAQLDPDDWAALPDALRAAARRAMLTPKPYRNNFFLAMAIGLLAQGRLGAAACCYNFFFHYHVPARWLGNGLGGTVGTAAIATTAEALACHGELLASPQVIPAVTVPTPIFLNRPNPPARHAAIALPQPVYGVLPDVEAIGGTSLLLRGGHSAVYDYAETGPRAREPQCPNIIHLAGHNCAFHVPAQAIQVDEAFSLLHDHGHNYHHWLLEVLPRYLLARDCGLPAEVPLLVEGHMAPQMREILTQVFGGEPPLVEVPRGVSARVRRLHCMSDLSVNTVHTNCPPERGDILLSPTATAMLRSLAAPHFADIPGRYENVLILRRNVGFRRVINRGVLQSAMKSLGLWGFDPGTAGWADQVRVFSNARLIVAEAGAALANIVFCRPGATIVVLVNGHANSNYFYLAQLAAQAGARLFLFECFRLARSHEIGVQDDMIAPVAALCDWIERFIADRELQPPVDRPQPTRPAARTKPRPAPAEATMLN